jgi:hypothetical protein
LQPPKIPVLICCFFEIVLKEECAGASNQVKVGLEEKMPNSYRNLH